MLRRAVRAEEQEMKVQSGIQHQPLTSERKSEKNRTEESQVDERQTSAKTIQVATTWKQAAISKHKH